ncbi:MULTISPECIES: hypothetical protein [Acidiphilium]|uniref:Uncharacterized protein n=1 Tax=Acidiphilium rubrum TaxID=526 RepID=A0A8G2CIJ4_ACIRU|nr:MULTISPECIES: hypothetical protein [Acidiphilium]SIQ29253.1 hypothetical protein SAMN05421828_103103 [Acidiphilium rubrum]
MALGVRPSNWAFKTAGSAGINIDVFAATGGQIVMVNPRKRLERFNYGGIGAGAGFGLKLPRIGKLELSVIGHSIAGTVAPMPWWNTGKIFMTAEFRGAELSKHDFTGACIFVEINVGIIEGASATGMLMGIDPEAVTVLGASVLSGMDLFMFLRHPTISPKALLVMGGRNAGIQAGTGVAGYLGIVT